MEKLLTKGKREMKPLLLKVGVALALSFAGYLYTHLRSQRPLVRPPHPPPGEESEDRWVTGGSGHKDEVHLMTEEEASPKVVNSGSASVVLLSPRSKGSGDEEGYLLPEFNEVVLTQFELTGRDQHTPASCDFRRSEIKDGTEAEKEVSKLRNLVSTLKERVRHLEMQLLEYYGIKEQESTMKEIENRLKINTMEAKLFSMKIDSLQADNRRLEAQVLEFSSVKAELESAKTKIKLLKRKIWLESEQAKEKMAALQQRLVVLQDGEYADVEHSNDIELRLEKLKDLEDETVELRRMNSRLALENLDLGKKLESTQMLVSSVFASPEVAKVVEEAKCQRQRHDELTKEIEQLQMDRCADAEELVYLKWVNACLRFELRNYQPPQGKTIARDLSKSLSPKSEEKAKQLILEYANSGSDQKNNSLIDYDLECYSSPQASTLTESEEDNASVEASTPKRSASSKTKFFQKLERLVFGKDIHSNRFLSSENSMTRASFSSFDDAMGRDSCDSSVSCITVDHASRNQVKRLEVKADEQHQNKPFWNRSISMDLQRRRISSPQEVGGIKGESSSAEVFYGQKGMELGEESILGSPHSGPADHRNVDSPEKVELKKFANVLKELPRYTQEISII